VGDQLINQSRVWIPTELPLNRWNRFASIEIGAVHQHMVRTFLPDRRRASANCVSPQSGAAAIGDLQCDRLWPALWPGGGFDPTGRALFPGAVRPERSGAIHPSEAHFRQMSVLSPHEPIH